LVKKKSCIEKNLKWDADESECLKCENNLNCIEEYVSNFTECPTKTKSGEACTGHWTENKCSYQQRNICDKLRHLHTLRKIECKNLGQPWKEKVEKCVVCERNTFRNCEIWENLLVNLRNTFSEAKEYIEDALDKAIIEPGTCFQKFDFENICWKECELKLNCLRDSQIYPNIDCANWDPDITDPLQGNCLKCYFKPICENIREGELSELKKEEERKKMFSGFFTVQEIRQIFTLEEE